jgi:hypothetical protein
MTKIPNGGAARDPFRSLENSNLGIVSDFGFRISNLINDLTEQNKTPCSQQPRLWVTVSFARQGVGGIFPEDLQNGDYKQGRHLYCSGDGWMNPFHFEYSQFVLPERKRRILVQISP